MSKILLVFTALCLLAMPLSGCSGKPCAPARQAGLTKQMLLHHNFVLTSINGRVFTGTERIPYIEFTEGFRASGRMCNQFTGQADLAGNTLSVKQMASTRMMCPDAELNQFENDFSQMLMEGAKITLDDNMLTLTGNGHVMIFRLQDYISKG